ncbi:MAG: hypothetical protein R3B99_07905 [Polyangiales bacterium]|nr:hypothetical protein [Myxococcales bacterium]
MRSQPRASRLLLLLAFACGGSEGPADTPDASFLEGDAALPVLDATSDAFVPDADTPDGFVRGDEEVVATLDASGGALTIEGPAGPITLEVPPGALLAPTTITATLLRSYPLAGFRTGVHFEPEGLVFHVPVTVHLPAAEWAFGYVGLGEDSHLLNGRFEAEATAVVTSHFSGYGVGTGPAPSTTPTASEAQARDAAARGDTEDALVALRRVFAETRPTWTLGTASRVALEAAIDAYSRVLGLADSIGLRNQVTAEVADAVALIRDALVAERDRIFDAATTSGRWQELMDLETFLSSRILLLGLREDPELSTAGITAAMPLSVTLDASLSFDDADGRAHAIGTAQAVLTGNGPIGEPVLVRASLVGSRVTEASSETTDGAFDLAFTTDREAVRAELRATFPGLPIYSPSVRQSLSGDNTLPLRVVASLSRSAIAVGDGSNLEVTAFRGAGPLGLAGNVALTIAPSACELGASSGTPDEDGRVLSTVSCSADALATVQVTLTHRGETVSTTVELSVGTPPRRQDFDGMFEVHSSEFAQTADFVIDGAYEVLVADGMWSVRATIRGGTIERTEGIVRPSCENFSYGTYAFTVTSGTTPLIGPVPIGSTIFFRASVEGTSSFMSRGDGSVPLCSVESDSFTGPSEFDMTLSYSPTRGELAAEIAFQSVRRDAEMPLLAR